MVVNMHVRFLNLLVHLLERLEELIQRRGRELTQWRGRELYDLGLPIGRGKLCRCVFMSTLRKV